MNNTGVVLTFGLLLAVVLGWAICVLPRPRWQFLAAVPLAETRQGSWVGLNLTAYGFWTATAVTSATAVWFVLVNASGVPSPGAASFALLLLASCLTTARLLARWIEGKPETFTIGGAAFVGLLLAPCAVWLLNRAPASWSVGPLPFWPVLGALAIAYTFGESLGRLACLSFGCCYGKPIAAFPARLQPLLTRWTIRFPSPTHKAAYRSGLRDVPLFPVQVVTAVVCAVAGLIGLSLYVTGAVRGAFLECILLSHSWRFLSEYLREDERGGGRLSWYQVMAALGAAFALLLALYPVGTLPAGIQLGAGLSAIWNPAMLLSFQVLWLSVFIYTGRSRVTSSLISWQVRSDRV
jgi:prolipoprotein diacylglyceryltransferase